MNFTHIFHELTFLLNLFKDGSIEEEVMCILQNDLSGLNRKASSDAYANIMRVSQAMSFETPSISS